MSALTTAPNMENIEQRRLQLEESVAMLGKTLEHWSAWEVEYTMLKEELEKADSPSPAAMIKIGRDLGGRLVNEKEVTELLGKDLRTKRTANQVVDMIARRIDYVVQNRVTVEKQLDKAEKQLEGASVLADPGLETEDGLPMMDIEEELGEDGEVLKSSVTQPGKVAPELMEALRKAGIHKEELKNPASKTSSSASSSKPSTSAPTPSSKSSKPETSAKPAPELSPAKPDPEAPKSAKKKSVAFAEDVQVKTFEKPSGIPDHMKGWNLPPGSRVYELGDDEQVVDKHIIPVDETADEAQLRRDMIEFGLSEAGQVVAEMDVNDLEEFDDDDEDEDYDSDEDEEEDEHGRTTRPVLTEEYRRQMMELEKKLNARMVENVGPRPDLHPLAAVADDVKSLRIQKDEEFDETMGTVSSVGGEKNGVQFTEDVDKSETGEAAPKPPGPPPPAIADTIVERAPTVPQAPTAPSKPAKVSRFKSARASNQPPPVLPNPPMPEPPAMPTGPQGRTLAESVMEHTPSSAPQAPDEFDPIQLNREINTEYHRMRNKMISQQGGFKESEEEKDNPLMEEVDGKPKRVSRFMAAKLKADGL